MDAGRVAGGYVGRVVRFRVGAPAGQGVFLQFGQDPGPGDSLVGMFDTAGLAEFLVDAGNERIERHGFEAVLLGE